MPPSWLSRAPNAQVNSSNLFRLVVQMSNHAIEHTTEARSSSPIATTKSARGLLTKAKADTARDTASDREVLRKQNNEIDLFEEYFGDESAEAMGDQDDKDALIAKLKFDSAAGGGEAPERAGRGEDGPAAKEPAECLAQGQRQPQIDVTDGWRSSSTPAARRRFELTELE